MARKTSVTLIVFGVINCLIALVPPCAGLIKASSEVKDDKLRRLARFDERDDDRDRGRDRY